MQWRGFAHRITPGGELLPTSSGLRSPAGVEISPWGDAFYTDNQGEWCGASKLSHLEPGDFHGHPHGIESCKLPEWKYGYPGDPVDGTLMPLVHEAMEIWVREMPDIYLSQLIIRYPMNTSRWVGWPTSEDPYGFPHSWQWELLKTLIRLRPAGSEIPDDQIVSHS